MNCNEVFEHLTRTATVDSGNGTLANHLAGCRSCRELAELYRPAIDLFGNSNGHEDHGDAPPPWQRVWEAVAVAESLAAQVRYHKERPRNLPRLNRSVFRHAAVLLVGVLLGGVITRGAMPSPGVPAVTPTTRCESLLAVVERAGHLAMCPTCNQSLQSKTSLLSLCGVCHVAENHRNPGPIDSSPSAQSDYSVRTGRFWTGTQFAFGEVPNPFPNDQPCCTGDSGMRGVSTRNQSRKLSMESLEERAILSADLTVELQGKDKDLAITGGTGDYCVDLAATDKGVLVSSCSPGTTINGREKLVNFKRLRDDIVFRLTDATSEVRFRNLAVPDDIEVQLRGPAASSIDLLFENIRVTDEVNIYTANADSLVAMIGSLIVDDIGIFTGDGDDEILLDGIIAEDDLDIETGSGTNLVTLARLVVLENLNLGAGPGNDRLVFTEVTVGNDLNISTGDGHDTVVFTLLDVVSDLKVDTSAGDDFIRFDRSLLEDSVLVTLGSDNDHFCFSGTLFQQGNGVNVDGGLGDDTLANDHTNFYDGPPHWLGFEFETHIIPPACS